MGNVGAMCASPDGLRPLCQYHGRSPILRADAIQQQLRPLDQVVK
jgi:hypothetical protein